MNDFTLNCDTPLCVYVGKEVVKDIQHQPTIMENLEITTCWTLIIELSPVQMYMYMYMVLIFVCEQYQ